MDRPVPFDVRRNGFPVRRCDRTAHLSPSAAAVLAAVPRDPHNPWVVPGTKPGKHTADIDGA